MYLPATEAQDAKLQVFITSRKERQDYLGQKRARSPDDQSSGAPAKKQSKWTDEENKKIIRLRGDGEKWERISEQLPGRSAISCRLHYQNFLERRAQWSEDQKSRLARLWDRFKKGMFAEMAKELEMPWRAVEAMHWELGAEGIAQRTGNPVFTTIPSSEPAHIPPIISQSLSGPPYYPTYSQSYLPPPQVVSSGPPPTTYPQSWASPAPSYRVQSVSGSREYWSQQQSYVVVPPPTNLVVNVPRQRRSTSTTSSGRTRKFSGSRRPTVEAPSRPNQPTSLQRSLTQPYDPSRHLPALTPEPPVPTRHETVPPAPLPSFTAANTSSHPTYCPPPYPSPPNDTPLRLPTTKGSSQKETPSSNEPRASFSPRPGLPEGGAVPEHDIGNGKGNENTPPS